MNKWVVRFSMVALVAVIALGTVGFAAAQDNPPQPGGSQQPGQQRPILLPRLGTLRGQVADAIVNATGLSREEILSQLRDGQTLNGILAANNIDPQVVIDAVTTVVTDDLNQAVADGRITQERADQVLANLPDNLDRLMNATAPGGLIQDRIHQRLEDSLIGVLAEMAGQDVGDVLRDAVTPPSLADLAAQYGLDADAIIATTEQRITDDVNQAVDDGRLTEDQAAQILDGLHDRLVERFNAPFRPLMWGMQGMQNRPGIMGGQRPGGMRPGGPDGQQQPGGPNGQQQPDSSGV
jgi:polyhydroxyalkanoate synthesis regulator phasin